MTTPRLLQDLSLDDVRDLVRRALRRGLDAESLADFLASVDWSNPQAADPAVARVLGQIELWATEYAEGDRSQADYTASLRSLLEPSQASPRRASG